MSKCDLTEAGHCGLKILHLAVARPVCSSSSYVLTIKPARTDGIEPETVAWPEYTVIVKESWCQRVSSKADQLHNHHLHHNPRQDTVVCPIVEIACPAHTQIRGG